MSAWQDNDYSPLLSWTPVTGARLAAASVVAWRFPIIKPALQARRLFPLELSFTTLDGVLGWGARLQAKLARRYAALRGLKYWSLEDGFLRSVGLGKARHAALSILVDDLGIHHDPLVASRLERLIVDSPAADAAHGRDVRRRLIEEKLTKYNWQGSSTQARLPRARKSKRILLVDQVAGDASTARYGSAAFQKMWTDALDQDAELLVRGHPDVIAGFADGALQKIAYGHRRDLLDGSGPIDEILPEVDEVWTVSSQFGFESLLRGKRVITYGMPFYAGWGLTEDRATDTASNSARARRKVKAVDIDQLVAASMTRYPIYFDPVSNRRVGIDQAMDRLCSWRREAGRFNGKYLCVGFSRHKHQTARLFLSSPSSTVAFTTATLSAIDGSKPHLTMVHWGHARNPSDYSHLTMEDGFIRSVGLGAELHRARSLCIDPVGIYYDATCPSHLENILNETVFDAALLARARRLRGQILTSNITKYNLPGTRFDAKALRTDRPIALVAEQVPDDASLRFGLPVHRSSLELLAAVRAQRPCHFILFKRHPDVVSGKRPSQFSTSDYAAHADYVLDEKAEIDWHSIAECHSATSQLGFEALLRGVKTYCHGAPFYSGWGLTIDMVDVRRRRRTLSIDELVAGSLLLYPSYRCLRSRLPCDAEDVIRDIAHERDTHVDGWMRQLWASR